LEWLWTHEKYTAWSASETSSLLYVEGKPGSGKSTLAKYFTENIARIEPNNSSTIVAHYFYTFRGTIREATHSNMLRSILYTILEQDDSFFFHFQGDFRQLRRRRSSEWPYDSLKRVLSSLGDHPVSKRLYLILDAIDESDENDRREITKFLCQLCSREESCVIKIFLASRPVAGLDSLRNHHVIILQEENKHDISRFTDDFLLLDINLADGISAQIKEYITTHARGVFVWVHLATRELLDYVEGGQNMKHIIHFLEGIPKDLEGFYQMMLERLYSGSDRDIADGLKIFQFVLLASRPLRVVELQHALAIPGGYDPLFLPTHEIFQENINEDIEKRILHCGGNFLETKGLGGISPDARTL
jgi:ABC-type hemin transport system ATPase subunit